MMHRFTIAVSCASLWAVMSLAACSTSDYSSRSGSDETTNGFSALIRNADGTAASAAKVTIRPEHWVVTPGIAVSVEQVRDLVADPEGNIHLDTLPPGSYRLTVQLEGQSFTMLQSVPWSKRLDTLDLQKSITVTGEVALPPGSSMATISIEGTDLWTRVGADGSYSLTGVPTGELILLGVLQEQGLVFARDTLVLEQPGDTLTGIQLTPLSSAEMSWSDSATLTLDTRTIGLGAALDSFALQLDLGDSLFPQGIAAEGADLRITDLSGNAIPFEITQWVPSERRLRLVFLAANIPAADSVAIARIKWGNPAALPDRSALSVFDTAQQWAGVWHLNQFGTDSLGRLVAPASVAGTGAGVVRGALTATGSGVWFDGTLQHIAFPPLALDLARDPVTVEFWIRPESEGIAILNRSPGLGTWNHQQKLIYLGTPDSSASKAIGLYPSIVGTQIPSNAYSFADSQLILGDFQHLVMRRQMVAVDSGRIEWFLNGRPLSSVYPDSVTVWEADDLLDSLYLGGDILGRGMQGWIRELTLSKEARSADWIKMRFYSTRLMDMHRIVHVVR